MTDAKVSPKVAPAPKVASKPAPKIQSVVKSQDAKPYVGSKTATWTEIMNCQKGLRPDGSKRVVE